MTDCATCGHPMVWSVDHQQHWCAVYGTHAEIRRPAHLLYVAAGLATDARHERQRERMRHLRAVS